MEDLTQQPGGWGLRASGAGPLASHVSAPCCRPQGPTRDEWKQGRRFLELKVFFLTALKMACLLDEHCYVIFSWKEREAFTTQVETPTRRPPELHPLSASSSRNPGDSAAQVI